MKRILKIELRRAFTSKLFLVSLGLGCLLAIITLDYLNAFFQYQKPMTGIDFFFSSWMGGNSINIYGYIFFLLLPMLAVLPYADSFYADSKSGFAKNILIRTHKRDYLFAKYIAVFLAGGTVVLLPLLLSFLSAAMVLPAIIPQATSASHGIFITSMWHGLYYSHPFAYTFLYIGVDFVFAGLFATISLAVAKLAQNRIVTLLAPFILYIFLSTAFDFFGRSDWAPMLFLPPGSGAGYGPVVLAEAVIGILLTFFAFVIRGRKDDVY